jgi:hypothetical protein
MDTTNQLRCERKYLISGLSVQEIEEIIFLHPAIFHPIHQERFVNNIYFDNLELSSYFENLSGITPRKKVRIRWYGELQGQIKKPILEIKKKSGIVGNKAFHPLSDFVFEDFFSNTRIWGSTDKGNYGERGQKELSLLEPTLINRYKRKYFLSSDRCYRITLDSEISFFPVRPFLPKFFETEPMEFHSILELKYDHAKDDKASEIANHFPFRLTRSSKYVSGIFKLYS